MYEWQRATGLPLRAQRWEAPKRYGKRRNPRSLFSRQGRSQDRRGDPDETAFTRRREEIRSLDGTEAGF